jgi:hypothetical protein
MGLLGSGLGMETEVVEDGDGVTVTSSFIAAGGSGDVEAHGELELCALATVLKGTRSLLSELKGAHVGVDLS